MSRAWVVDASTVVKWFIPEEYSAQAESLLSTARRIDIPLVGPPILISEVLNALYQRARRGDLTGVEVDRAVRNLHNFGLQLISPGDIYNLAYQIASLYHLTTTYDALYIALAEELQVDLWTADEALLRATHDYPHASVRSLSTFPLD